MEHTGLNYVDLAVFAIILLSGLMALIRGFLREALALGSWVAASFAAVYFYPYAQPLAHKYIHNEHMADIAAGTLIFCLVLALFIPLGIILGGLVKGKALTAVDRSLGFVFGTMRGALIVCLLFLVTLWVWPEQKSEPEVLAQARTRPVLAYGAEMVKSMLPKHEMKKMTESIGKLGNLKEADVNRAKESMDKLTAPASTAASAPAYDNTIRYGLDNLINQQGKRP